MRTLPRLLAVLAFAPAGYRDLGKRYAETLLPLLGFAPSDSRQARRP